jgi:hypothetical protein
MTHRVYGIPFPLVVATVAGIGGLSWVTKVGVIVATGGAVAGFWLGSGRGLPLRAAAAVLGLIGFFVLYFVLDTIARGIAGDRGPDYAADEVGILLTGIVALLASVWLWLRYSRSSSTRTSGER